MKKFLENIMFTTTRFYKSKWIVGCDRKVYLINLGDIITHWGNCEKEYKITSINSNGYCDVLELNKDRYYTTLPFYLITSVRNDTRYD